ncbi:MAG: response regulator transcription factor [Deltaproteobacteria bacterium]|nr:response regulator transcription factor [Deltaproteobacteria bacterium]
MSILIIEQDRGTLQYLSRLFAEAGYSIQSCGAGANAWEHASAASHELIVLDWMPPTLDVLGLCRRLRQAGNQTPILMLTTDGDVGARVAGLDAGADDCLARSADPSELIARARALLRRANSCSDVIRAGPVVIDLHNHTVRVQGELISFSARELAVLTLLVRNVGATVTKVEMLSHVWETRRSPGSNVVEAQIHNLRRKLGPAASWLTTVCGQGYLFSQPEDGGRGIQSSIPSWGRARSA